MNATPKSNEPCCEPTAYEIRIQGHLHDRWTERFERMRLTWESDGTTKLYGRLPDQNALHVILERIRDMNLKLISVKRVKPDIDVDIEYENRYQED